MSDDVELSSSKNAESGAHDVSLDVDAPEGAAAAADVRHQLPFFVVGVGASAGGLEALTALVREIEIDSMAFVVITHMAPDRDSQLPALLARSTPLEVKFASDGMPLAANCVYVMPPDANVTIVDGVLHTVPLSTGQRRMPVDVFFRSLAEDQGSRAIGVVLSGSGSDGTFGLRAIKEAGGFTFAQEPNTAQYGSMPHSAIVSGAVDKVLPPAAIAAELVRIGKHPYIARPPRNTPEHPDGIAQLLMSIRQAFGHDLTQYKPSTIERRIARRMALQKLDRIDDYLQVVHGDRDELRSLYRDILISVTSFFRDHEPFEALKSKVFPRIMEDKGLGASIRIWVPACATGEEPYSLAMTLVEALGDRAGDYRIQVFGTDVEDESVQFARRGIYAPHIALDVSPERLLRFFVKRDGGYQINRRIRDLVVFSTHNVAKDAPFSRIDVVSCRNLLIYLQPAMQKKVLRVLHYALNPSGYLMLGSSETVGDSPDLFTLLDRKNRIYLPKHLTARATIDLVRGTQPLEPATRPRLAAPRPLATVASLADRKILELYAPPGVVINENLEILHFRGRTGAFLEPAPGEASLNVLRLARPELHADLRKTIHQALTDDAKSSAVCTITEEGKVRSFRLEVIPMVEPETHARCLLVVFNDPPAAPTSDERSAEEAISPAEQRIAELERELAVTKDYLQSTIEELESSNEELKSANEELQSSNEELQSTNEELETSKEEMQSTNEELTTVNDELHMRMNELQVAYDDLHNVMTGADSAVLITGLDLRIRRYTQAAQKLFALVNDDVGRSINQLNAFFSGLRLDQAVTDVVQTLTPFRREVQCIDGRWRSVHATPYKTLEHSIKGAVIVCSDIDVRHRALRLAHAVSEYATRVLAPVNDPVLVLDANTRVVWLNQLYLDTFQVTSEETVGNLVSTIGSGCWSSPALAKLIDEAIGAGASFRDQLVRSVFPDVGEKAYAVSGARIPLGGAESAAILLTFREATVPTPLH